MVDEKDKTTEHGLAPQREKRDDDCPHCGKSNWMGSLNPEGCQCELPFVTVQTSPFYGRPVEVTMRSDRLLHLCAAARAVVKNKEASDTDALATIARLTLARDVIKSDPVSKLALAVCENDGNPIELAELVLRSEKDGHMDVYTGFAASLQATLKRRVDLFHLIRGLRFHLELAEQSLADMDAKRRG